MLFGATVRAAAQSAKRAGFHVVGADLFGDTDTLDACDEHVLLRNTTDWQRLSAATQPALKLMVGGICLNEFPAAGPFFDQNLFDQNPQPNADFKLPDSLRAIARECGLDVPESRRTDAWVRINAGKGDTRIAGQWLRKSLNSSGGLGVAWAEPVAASASKVPAGEVIFQRWMPGRPYGVTFFAAARKTHVMGIFRSLFVRRGIHPFVYAGSVGPFSEELLMRSGLANLKSRLDELGAALRERFGFRGLFNVDLVVDTKGRGSILEVNPRWTAASELVERSMIRGGHFSHGDSLIRWHVAARQAVTNFSLPEFLLSNLANLETGAGCGFKRVVYARRPGRMDVRQLRSLEQGEHLEFADLPPPSRWHSAGDPVFTVIGRLCSGRLGINRESSCPNRPTEGCISPQELRQTIRTIAGLMDHSPRSSAYE